MMFAGVAKFWHGDDPETIAWLRRSIEANRNFPSRISTSPPRWRCSGYWMRRGLSRRPD